LPTGIDRVTAALREVAEFLAGQTLDVDVETVSFAQHFPRQVDVLPHHHIVSWLSLLQKNFLSRRLFANTERSWLDTIRCMCLTISNAWHLLTISSQVLIAS
jgi:hypothetical protein